MNTVMLMAAERFLVSKKKELSNGPLSSYEESFIALGGNMREL